MDSIQLLGPLLRDTVRELLAERALGVGQLASELLHTKCRVGAHLAAIRGVALLECGVVMHQFFSFVLKQVSFLSYLQLLNLLVIIGSVYLLNLNYLAAMT